jgi:hypothetical protein
MILFSQFLKFEKYYRNFLAEREGWYLACGSGGFAERTLYSGSHPHAKSFEI